MKNITSTLIAASIFAASVVVVSAPAHAVSFSSCTTNTYNIADNVTGTSGCQISNDFNQDFLNIQNPSSSTVNQADFFDISNWTFGGKIGTDSGFLGTKEGQSGTWDISNVIQSSWNNVMLVFKSGNGTNLVGYKVTDGVTSGSWLSPFEKAAFGFNGNGTKDVSHISVYYTQGAKPPVTSVPEPASIVALSLVGGSILVSRRRISQSA
ncbi:PEP-CTERM sorting domain-containing protein [Calothrix sp. UHCC 0171]|uniref:PEP-CTERM sorting domain-containing protein n=1 Tax=Calothrix sp. UHCC 0171 TaxID=3110245 RepID=UPI002B21E48E|nr:PEP-CTERM sorting domain-containing protein [Calothrix sp. UHCC 0171]MEA5571014.1 PEP-CTERM sorting domain-containing protein [Calothrix sp. UHCC 0171]